MKTAKPPAKTSAAKISAAKPPTLRWLERPSLDVALRIGTAAMMAIAATLVLAHLTVYSLSLTNADFNRLQSSACFFARC